MVSADTYRKRASEFRAMARFAEDRDRAADYYRLADLYIRLAEQAEQNSKLDVAVEIGPPVRLNDEDPPR